jgi:hypothetical protein
LDRPQQPLRQRPVATAVPTVQAADSGDLTCLQPRADDSQGALQVPKRRPDEVTLPTRDEVELNASRAGDDPTGSESLAAVRSADRH